MQKSQRGLLQTLLCQVLRADPDLVTAVCPEHHPNEPWSLLDLKAAFRRLAEVSSSSASCFCFFIDALDEYEGREEDIIRVPQSLSQLPSIKVCVSSRPSIAFETVLTHSEGMLVVQNFTLDDMQHYIHGMLAENVDFKQLIAKDPRCELLAKGVWLWVFLVVRDLLRDVSGKEDYATLEKRLDHIPPTLEQYFERILDQIDPFFKEQAAQILLMASAAPYTMPVFTLHLLEIERANPDYALHEFDAPSSHEEFKQICDSWAIRLKTRCRDLLKVSGPELTVPISPFRESRVDFLHRSVRDFLQKDFSRKLRQMAPPGFNEYLSLGRAMIVLLQPSFDRFVDHPDPHALDCALYYANKIGASGNSAVQLEFIDAIRQIVDRDIEQGLFISKWSLVLPEFGPVGTASQPNFLSLAVGYRLTQYVKSKDDEVRKFSGPHHLRSLLISFALFPCFWDRNAKGITPCALSYPIDEELVAYLLSVGANVNEGVKHLFYKLRAEQRIRTALGHLGGLGSRNYQDPDLRQNWFSIAKLLVEHGGQLPIDEEDHDRDKVQTFKKTQASFSGIFSSEQIDILRAVEKAYLARRSRWSTHLLRFVMWPKTTKSISD